MKEEQLVFTSTTVRAAATNRETAELRRSLAKACVEFTFRRAVDAQVDRAEKGHQAIIGAVENIAGTATSSGNRAVADIVSTLMLRLPPSTNTALENVRKELMIRFSLKR